MAYKNTYLKTKFRKQFTKLMLKTKTVLINNAIENM